MRGSIWNVVALGVGIAFLPSILPDSGGGDTAGDAIFELVSGIAPVVGLTFVIAVFGLLLALMSFDRGF